MLEFINVSAQYGKIQALHEVSLSVRKGGNSHSDRRERCGENHTAEHAVREPRATTGEIRYLGENITALPTAQIMRKDIALVPEGRRVFGRMTVEENLAMGGFFASKTQYQARIAQVYELFPRLQERRHQRAGTMSGGEQQMLAIGRALMSSPQLLLLDEPSLGLAPIIIMQIFDTIRELRDVGMTIFLVEQNANQALKLADRGYVLENGRVVLEDTGQALLVNEAVRSAYLGG